eukprot:7517051-Lingulodinium_polyedra.AAC.1
MAAPRSPHGRQQIIKRSSRTPNGRRTVVHISSTCDRTVVAGSTWPSHGREMAIAWPTNGRQIVIK